MGCRISKTNLKKAKTINENQFVPFMELHDMLMSIPGANQFEFKSKRFEIDGKTQFTMEIAIIGTFEMDASQIRQIVLEHGWTWTYQFNAIRYTMSQWYATKFGYNWLDYRGRRVRLDGFGVNPYIWG